MDIPLFAIILIVIALFFEFSNGFHDTSNAVATSISTKSLSPFQAISISAAFNLIGALCGTAVAVTIAKGFADPGLATQNVILAALLAAITWNLATWYFGIPSSSSHALIGVKYATVFFKVILPMVISPLIGFCVAMLIVIIIHRILRNNTEPRKTNNYIRELQVLSTAFLSFSHGSNDAQKTMGIITLTLFNFHLIQTADVPRWVIFACAFCMSVGTLAGGMRIIKTLSTRVAKLRPVSGFAAELSSALVLFAGSRFGIPLSTTHAVAGSIMGAGNASATGRVGVNWSVVKNMVTAWVLTLPMCILISGGFLFVINLFS